MKQSLLRGSVRSLVRSRKHVAVLTACIVQLGCVGEVVEEEAWEESRDDLYQLDTLWPGGVVGVCFIGGGNTPNAVKVKKWIDGSWGSSGADLTFNWWTGPCIDNLQQSLVRVHFMSKGTSFAETLGPFPPFFCCGRGGRWSTGYTDVWINVNDPAFRAITIHEFGHALGFGHEQERPDNWDASGRPIFCDQVQDNRKGRPGGRYLTGYDAMSIMNYCSGARALSEGDKRGAIAAYGRK